MSRYIDQSPDPKSHIKTLMRIGYTLDSAISDIIDNSLAAKSNNVRIFAPPGLIDPIISILDDGVGMDREELIQNMRIGCKDPNAERAQGDLGRFGSGMKTASFSQARQLTVITKKVGSSAVAARWDIDEIEGQNAWCLEVFEDNEILNIEGLQLTEDMAHGTQVIWGKLTCFERGSHALDHDTEIASKMTDLKKYLSLYFHRFLEGKNKINFYLNNLKIEPIDPFMTTAPGYQEGRSEKLRCRGGKILIKTHVLPHFNRMDAEQLDRMGGSSGVSQDQGLYIYREGRLISAGGWLGLAKISQLGALARVQVDVPSSIDNEWSTDVKKSSIQLPPRVKRELKKFLSDPIQRSKRAYTYRGKTDKANKYWQIIEDENEGSITYQFDPENKDLVSLLLSCEKKSAVKILEYLKELSLRLPIHHIYEKMAEKPKDVDQSKIDKIVLGSILEKIFMED